MQGLRNGLESNEPTFGWVKYGLTLHAYTNAVAQALSKPSRFCANNVIAFSLVLFPFKRRRRVPQTSAIARWISGKHFGMVEHNSAHVTSSSFELDCKDGARRYLKRAANVARRVSSASVETCLGRKDRRTESRV
jgi:hypothetical protein